MIKKIFFAIVLLLALQGRSQLYVNWQLPPMGIVEKSQLWNMLVTNTGNAAYPVHLELTFSNVSTGQPIMSASSQTVILEPGIKQLNANLLGPIQYNNLSSGFIIDAAPSGLLPAGAFEVCYSYFKHTPEGVEKMAEECREILIEPLSPPQLLYPYNQTAIAESNPLFSWLPPAPQNVFFNLNYDFTLVEVYPNQTAIEAVEQNYPLYKQQNITMLSLPYPPTAPSLEINKQYAWHVTANNAQTPVAQSEVWEFTLKQHPKADSLEKSGFPYVKLRKGTEDGYAIFSKELKFDYLNETSDTTWNISIYDLSKSAGKKLSFSLDNIPLKPGQNLVSVPIAENTDFLDKHFYLLEVTNSRNEVWRLRFQYYTSKEH